MDKVIEMTRELGKLIQQDARYKAYVAAREKNDNDPELQKMISEFNDLRVELAGEMSKDDKDAEKLTQLDDDIKNLYGSIMGSELMMEFEAAKAEMDSMLSQINTVITQCANGEDPDTCPVTTGCTGSCESCAGCH
ncbi:MAG: YlbF family regulator [Oscillospiraceae bacterium]|nr:YlbF family regulator [Oscillospiraceae bacterium]MBR6834796.1 YlbF family regulator [Oscillospiraceae bacterium]MBR6924952.1 YlbF family regulator [Oscillospiraceae bacterium]